MLLRLLRTALLSLSACFALTQAAPSPFRLGSRSLTFDYSSQKVRGVNLGGWLVLEPWITPSIFEAAGNSAVDEWTLSQILANNALSTLSTHWNTWITADDFAHIASLGLNHVRIPIGYWAINPLPSEPFVQGQLSLLDQAIGWARTSGIKVIIDLHGAPGSQNGFDNSGRRGNIEWQQGFTVNQTLDAIQALASRYVNDADVVAAIELLNEPFVARGVQLDPLKQFYYDGWGRIRQYSHDTTVVIHDGFLDPVSAWNGFMNAASGVWYVMLDTHHYEIFDSGQLQISTDQHIQAACSFGSNEVAKTDKWTIVGEWTGALTDCAKYLNGRGVGARYDGTYQGSTAIIGSCNGKSQGSVAGLSADEQTSIRRFIEAQLDAFEMNTGWIYWTWKTEGAPEWDMQQQIAGGVFPNPVTSRKFPKAC
ncbi:hypothetical protein Egran_01235 [Elaphomyces granulatus]|uniref:glucan 1,3-beta-glucosidase n=1 Tax=Elaphomyces granulatus TaxID=519963 RepID=A0A232M4J4_9EURO|nr:hypothetical protein Egran_01235 [Elaphomyces granulatus]